jgi:osmotically-inducible protein OsmY
VPFIGGGMACLPYARSALRGAIPLPKEKRMKKLQSAITLTALLAALSGGLLLSACSSTPTKESTGEVVDDSWITTKVKAAFVEDPVVSALGIKVETFKGVVQLSGFANNSTEIQRAAEIARGIKGVKEVKNDVRLKSSTG